MTKTELEAQLAVEMDMAKDDARELLNVVLDEITLALSRQQKVALIGFGSFEVRTLAARAGRNPQTGQPLEIPAHNTVHFRPGKALKDAIAKSLGNEI